MDELYTSDVAELALKVCGVEQPTIDEYDGDNKLIIKAIQIIDNRFGIAFENFYDLVSELIKFTPRVCTECGDRYHAFVDPETSRLIVKKEVQQ